MKKVTVKNKTKNDSVAQQFFVHLVFPSPYSFSLRSLTTHTQLIFAAPQYYFGVMTNISFFEKRKKKSFGKLENQ